VGSTKPRVIGLYSSAPQSGKSEVRRILSNQHRFEPVYFAGPLKTMLRTLMGMSGMSPQEVEAHVDGPLKETPIGEPFHQSARYMMQTLGTEWGRGCVHPDIWLNVARSRVIHATGHGSDVVIDDLRFPNEAQMIIEDDRWDGYVVNVVRAQEHCAPLTGHHSDGLMEDWPFDGVVNNDTTLDRLPSNVHTLLKDLSST
jgi:hypothetical protein